MIREAISYLFDLGRTSADAVVRPPGEPAHVYYVRSPDGRLTKCVADPAPDDHRAFSLQAVVALADAHKGDTPTPAVWYSSGGVTLVYGVRNRIALALAPSEQMKCFVHWHGTRPGLTQAELTRILRTTFRDCLAAAPTLVEVLKKVRFNSGTVVNSEVGHGKASLGKEIMGEVTGTAAIPEYVRFDVPVFANPCFRHVRASVECALDPDAASGQFRVIPLPGQIEQAGEAGTEWIGDELARALPKGFPLYFGSP